MGVLMAETETIAAVALQRFSSAYEGDVDPGQRLELAPARAEFLKSIGVVELRQPQIEKKIVTPAETKAAAPGAVSQRDRVSTGKTLNKSKRRARKA